MKDIYSLKEGDQIVEVRDGRRTKLTVWRIDPPGSAMRAYSAGPRIYTHIRPGSYGMSFDLATIQAGHVSIYGPGELNVNGTPYELIDGDEYCLECEHMTPGHYEHCPLREP